MSPAVDQCPSCGHETGIMARYCAQCGYHLCPELGDAPPGLRAVDASDGLVDGGEAGSVIVDLPLAPDGLAGPRVGQDDTPGRRRSGGRGRSRRAASGPPDLLLVFDAPDRRSRAIRRYDIAAQLLALARSNQHLLTDDPAGAAAVFLRRFDGRRATQEAYAGDLADWFVWLGQAGVHPFEATLATIEGYAREPLASGRAPAPATAARRLACLSHYYRRAVYAGLIERNPVEQAERPRVSEQSATLGISKARAQQLLRIARAEGPRAALLVLLMLELGLRVSEVIGADIEDLSEQGRYQVLAIRGKGQRSKSTLVPLNKPVLDAIARAVAGRTSGPLLITANGRRLTRQHAGKIIKQLGEQIGLTGLHPHALRHAFVTLSLDENIPLRDVQDAARHADPRTTRRYDRNRHNLDRHPTHQLADVLEP